MSDRPPEDPLPSTLEPETGASLPRSPAGGAPPRVAIGLPVRNGARYLEAAIDSILCQTFSDFVLLVSDNASTDATPEIALACARRDPRVRYERSERYLGAAPNFNRVFRRTSSEYFKWAAHDDVLAPGYLEECVAFLDAHPSSIGCHSRSVRIDEHGKPVGTYDEELRLGSARPSDRFRRVLFVDHFTEIWALFRSSALRRTRLLRSFIGSDRNLLAALLLQGDLGYVGEYLFLRRDHPQSYCRAVTSRTDRLRWFDTSPRLPLLAGVPAKVADFALTLSRTSLPLPERLRCLRHLAARSWARTAHALLPRGLGTPPERNPPSRPVRWRPEVRGGG